MARLVLGTDRLRAREGCGTCLIRYTERLAEAGLEPSVGSVGALDALAGTIKGWYEAEVIDRRPFWSRREDVEWGHPRLG